MLIRISKKSILSNSSLSNRNRRLSASLSEGKQGTDTSKKKRQLRENCQATVVLGQFVARETENDIAERERHQCSFRSSAIDVVCPHPGIDDNLIGGRGIRVGTV